MAIYYYAEDTDLPKIEKQETTCWIEEVVLTHQKKCGNISYIFCSDAKILEVNREFLQHDYYTDIITFDYTQGNRIGGDLFISLDTVRSNAQLFGTTFELELMRVIIHGVLHLCGINDKSDAEQAIMTREENNALTLLKKIETRRYEF